MTIRYPICETTDGDFIKNVKEFLRQKTISGFIFMIWAAFLRKAMLPFQLAMIIRNLTPSSVLHKVFIYKEKSLFRDLLEQVTKKGLDREIVYVLCSGAEDGGRTRTVVTHPRILSPVRLPIPPPRHATKPNIARILGCLQPQKKGFKMTKTLLVQCPMLLRLCSPER
jgi:hypothetical protein